MLFNLEKPSAIHKEMESAGEFIVALIEYCHSKGITDGQFDEQHFVRLKHHRKYKDCCLLKHPEAMRNRMRELFVVLPSTLMPVFIGSLKGDLNYAQDHQSSTFQFTGYLGTAFAGMLADTQRKVVIDTIKKVFEKLYDDFFGHKEENATCNNRDLFKEEYKRLNGLREHVCPACLGLLHIGKAQLDHYFPKSLFPALVIQPFNIVPICMECNSSVGNKQNKGKGNRVPAWPLVGEAVNDPGCMTGVYLPYIRSAERKFKAVVVGNPGNRVIRFEPLSSAAPVEGERIRRHVATFNLEKVWTDRIPFHFNILMHRTLSEFTRLYEDHVTASKMVTQDEVGEFLWNKLVLNSDDALYDVGYQFEFVSYVISLATTPASFHAFYRELIKRMNTRHIKAMPPLPHIYDCY
ncbi:MAG: hypothetical protein VR66_01685 [Peptococcaceae bacterium BRH_c23]|nr:MAG: hypothetical protein VR66_01685 [Peptococcaceae bacterium BRH_c23]